MPSPKPPTTSSPRPLPIIPLALITALFVFGVDALHLQLRRNGYIDYIRPLLVNEPRFLPGGEHLLVRQYTGVASVDHFFTTANVIWANVFDLSRPELTLFAFCFGGQLVPFFIVLMVEGQRMAKLSPLLNPLVWGILMQALGFGVIAPLFFITHLLVTSQSPISQLVRLRSPISLYTVIPALSLGYFAVSGLMAYPFPSTVHQFFNAVWQPFPLYVVGLQYLFTSVAKRTSVGGSAHISAAKRDRAALDHAYSFAWNAAVTTQLTTIMVVVVSATFPSLFPKGIPERLSLARIFGPGSPHSSSYMESPAAAIHDFFIYDLYIGAAAALVWGVYQLSQVQPVLETTEEQTKLAKGVFNSTLFAGPGGALVALMQHRDEIVLVAEEKAEKSK